MASETCCSSCPIYRTNCGALLKAAKVLEKFIYNPLVSIEIHEFKVLFSVNCAKEPQNLGVRAVLRRKGTVIIRNKKVTGGGKI